LSFSEKREEWKEVKVQESWTIILFVKALGWHRESIVIICYFHVYTTGSFPLIGLLPFQVFQFLPSSSDRIPRGEKVNWKITYRSVDPFQKMFSLPAPTPLLCNNITLRASLQNTEIGYIM
jgi:hypothetical protein